MRKLKCLKVLGMIACCGTEMAWSMKYSCILGSTGMTMNTVGWGNIGKTFTLNIPEDVEVNVSKEELKDFVRKEISEVIISLVKKIDFFGEKPIDNIIPEFDFSAFELEVQNISAILMHKEISQTEKVDVVKTFFFEDFDDHNKSRKEERDWVKKVFENFILEAVDKFRKERSHFHENLDYNLKMCTREVKEE